MNTTRIDKASIQITKLRAILEEWLWNCGCPAAAFVVNVLQSGVDIVDEVDGGWEGVFEFDEGVRVVAVCDWLVVVTAKGRCAQLYYAHPQ